MKEDVTKKWNECLALIRKRLGNDSTFSTWFAPAEAVSLRGNHLTLLLPSQFFVMLYEGEYFQTVTDAIRDTFGPGIKLTYRYRVVNDAPKSNVNLPSNGSTAVQTPPAPASAPKKQKQQAAKAPAPAADPEPLMPQLNQALTFENFCVGSSNKLPWSIAESIARQPVNSTFNPFFLYGDVGVGKTHLMQAIGLHVKKAFPDKKVVFLPMKEFQRLYQNAYLKGQIPAFLNWFMHQDVLLFDDLQEIAGSEGTLNNALFPIFNHLHHHGKQMVFTCDRAPQELKGLEERLIDRFKWGVTEKLERPDVALRKKILSFKARRNGLNLPQNVIDYVSEAPLNSVREIEGVVLGIYTRAISLGSEIDMELAREVLAMYVSPAKTKKVNFEMIVEAVAEAYRLNSDVIFSKSRVKDVADARMLIMYLAHQLLGLSAGSIGRQLMRKHSTVLHGIGVVAQKVAADSDFASFVKGIEHEM